jgi:hypothetical protein
MKRKRKKKNDILEAITPTLVLGGIGAGMGALGGAFGTAGAPLASAGGTIGGFARIAAPIGAGGYVLKQVVKLDRKKKKNFL